MRSIKDIIGKPIIAVDSGNKLGSISDALLDDGSVRVVAFVVGGGMLAKEHVVPFRDVQTLGGDTVLVRSQSAMVGPREWGEAGGRTLRSSSLEHRPVVTAEGRRLGEVSDITIDEQTGVLEALEVSATDLGGLRTRKSLVRPGADIRVGPDAIVVPDSAAREPEGDAAEDRTADRAPAAR